MRIHFKTVLFSAFTAIMAFSAVTYNSCKPDKCKEIRCAYGGVCKEGKCSCLSGYQGAQCDVVTREKFLGVWTVTEQGSMTDLERSYTIAIVIGDNITDVKIRNFYNLLTQDVYAIAHGDSLEIRSQNIEGRKIEGYAYLDHDTHYRPNAKMILRYAVTIDSSNAVDNYGLYPILDGEHSTALR